MRNCPYYASARIERPPPENGKAETPRVLVQVTWCSHPKHSPRPSPRDAIGKPPLSCEGDFLGRCLISQDLFGDA